MRRGALLKRRPRLRVRLPAEPVEPVDNVNSLSTTPLTTPRLAVPSPTESSATAPLVQSANGLIENINDVIQSNVADATDTQLVANLTNVTTTKEPSGFFYIIQTADVPLGIYKIGKTARSNPNKRLCEYPKFSSVKYTISVSNCHVFESYAMRKFRVLFKRKREYGLEYYEGNIIDMINLAHTLWNKFESTECVVDTRIEKIKPNGFQYFINEYYSNQTNPTLIESYDKYVDMMKNTFMTNEYADEYTFITYLNYILNS